MNKPYFSIIIPTRTMHSQIVDDLLPTLNVQLFDDFEVFITPDKTDKSDKKLEKSYPWLHIIEAKENKRPGIKRDICVQKSKGGVLVFIDDDVVPPKHWLKNAHRILKKDTSIAALGGPGILPSNAPFWERVFDATLTTWLGSGSFTYRFQKESARHVDDFPSMNLMIRKSTFLKTGGFDNGYWPGEDSKLLDKFADKNGGAIYYHPDVFVYHHRRDTLRGHLLQHKNYGKTRGLFAAQGDINSKHLIYLIPSLFVMYCFVVIVISLISRSVLSTTLIPLSLYIGFLSYVFLKTSIGTESILIGLGTVLVIPATHITYGLWYMIGYMRK